MLSVPTCGLYRHAVCTDMHSVEDTHKIQDDHEENEEGNRRGDRWKNINEQLSPVCTLSIIFIQ